LLALEFGAGTPGPVGVGTVDGADRTTITGVLTGFGAGFVLDNTTRLFDGVVCGTFDCAEIASDEAAKITKAKQELFFIVGDGNARSVSMG
jgi:hypothetical protein